MLWCSGQGQIPGATAGAYFAAVQPFLYLLSDGFSVSRWDGILMDPLRSPVRELKLHGRDTSKSTGMLVFIQQWLKALHQCVVAQLIARIDCGKAVVLRDLLFDCVQYAIPSRGRIFVLSKWRCVHLLHNLQALHVGQTKDDRAQRRGVGDKE
jgi:hypothetical protein